MPQYDTDNMITNTIGNTTKSFTISEVWLIVSIILAVIGGIYLCTTYLKKEHRYTGIKKVICDFLTFKINIIEHLFKLLYIILTITLTLSSFSLITTSFIHFIGILVFGNILLRLIFEFLLLTLKLFKDVSEINKKLTKKEIKPKREIKLLTKKNKKAEVKDI